jgi:YVTN family beta-propeller protein
VKLKRGWWLKIKSWILILGIALLASCQSNDLENLQIISIPEKRSSSAITITNDGGTVLAVNPDSNSLTIVNADKLEIIKEITVGLDPRTVSVDDKGYLAVTANRGIGTISIIHVPRREVIAEVEVGALPWGVVISHDGIKAYVACEEDDWIAVVDTKKREVVSTIPVEDRPNGLALSHDEELLYITHLLTAKVSILDLSKGEVIGVIPTWVDGNLSQSIILHPQQNKAYLPLTRSNTTNTRLSFDTTVFPLVTVVDLENREMVPKEIISLPEADQPVGLPYDGVFSPEGDILYLVNAASNDLSVINLDTGLGIGHINVGHNPRGVDISPDGQRLFVNNTLSGTVSVIDTENFMILNEIQVTRLPLPPILLQGKRLFHSSRHPVLSREAWISCNTCHWEGEHDGRTWEFDFAGPRNTTSLLGMINTYPLRWSAEWDESADSEFAITEEQFGSGLLDGDMHPTLGEPNTGRSSELDSLASFIDSLAYLPNFQVENLEWDLVETGKKLFYDPETGCGDCHSGPYFTDFQTHDVGTADGEGEVMGPLIDTPTLLSLTRSAPYLHDGSAETLLEVLTSANPNDLHGMTSHLSDKELSALVEYMLSLDLE